MRSGLTAGLMGVGGILVSFGFVVVVLSFFARQGGATRLELPAMGFAAAGSLVIGALMLAAGYLLSRVGERPEQPARSPG